MHEIYIRRTFELAQRGFSGASPNPLVGCCIVCNGKIIGEGWHRQYGEAHAEVNAIADVAPENHDLLSQSTLYVSLEPCCYHGNTPPCTDLILKHRIPNVVMSSTDPNPRISGAGAAQLRKHGVTVTTGILADEGAWLNRRFFTYIQKKRPYVILKYAQSVDGFMGKKDEQIWISGQVAKRLTHKWRSEEDAILVGTNTARIDNPQLNTRLWKGKSPMRVVPDRVGGLPHDLHIFDGGVKTQIFIDEMTNLPDSSYHNVFFTKINFTEKVIPQILDNLFEQRIKSIIVEGGAALLNSFISENLWDEARIFTANHALKEGIRAPEIKGELVERKKIGKDVLTIFKYYIQ